MRLQKMYLHDARDNVLRLQTAILSMSSQTCHKVLCIENYRLDTSAIVFPFSGTEHFANAIDFYFLTERFYRSALISEILYSRVDEIIPNSSPN